MERLLKVSDIMERYCCNKDTAYKYMRQMWHMENPLRVTESAVEEWERKRTKPPINSEPKEKTVVPMVRRVNKKNQKPSKFLIPRERPEVI